MREWKEYSHGIFWCVGWHFIHVFKWTDKFGTYGAGFAICGYDLTLIKWRRVS